VRSDREQRCSVIWTKDTRQQVGFDDAAAAGVASQLAGGANRSVQARARSQPKRLGPVEPKPPISSPLLHSHSLLGRTRLSLHRHPRLRSSTNAHCLSPTQAAARSLGLALFLSPDCTLTMPRNEAKRARSTKTTTSDAKRQKTSAKKAIKRPRKKVYEFPTQPSKPPSQPHLLHRTLYKEKNPNLKLDVVKLNSQADEVYNNKLSDEEKQQIDARWKKLKETHEREMQAFKAKFKYRRHALVIGQSKSPSGDVPQSKDDAQQVEFLLERMGWFVVAHLDLPDQASMEAKIEHFLEGTRQPGIYQATDVLIYYSGHGLSRLSTKAKPPRPVIVLDPVDGSDVELDFEAIQQEYNQRKQPVVLGLILDTCRNEQARQKTRKTPNKKPPAAPFVPNGFIAYACKPGASASAQSSGSKFSPYTEALLKHIDSKEDINYVFRTVCATVHANDKSSDQQEPWYSESIKSTWYSLNPQAVDPRNPGRQVSLSPAATSPSLSPANDLGFAKMEATKDDHNGEGEDEEGEEEEEEEEEQEGETEEENQKTNEASQPVKTE